MIQLFLCDLEIDEIERRLPDHDYCLDEVVAELGIEMDIERLAAQLQPVVAEAWPKNPLHPYCYTTIWPRKPISVRGNFLTYQKYSGAYGVKLQSRRRAS